MVLRLTEGRTKAGAAKGALPHSAWSYPAILYLVHLVTLYILYLVHLVPGTKWLVLGHLSL